MNYKTRLLNWSLATMATAVFLISSVPAQKGPQRVYFARGVTVARVTGHLNGIGDEAVFVLRAGTGQHMRVEINGRGATRGVVIFPSGKQDGGPGGVVFDGKIDETGDYRIRVTENSMANEWRGSLVLKIEILPADQSSGASTSDLERYAGQYPSALFRGVPSLKTRLRQVLGVNYKSFFDRLQVEMPIERDGNTLVARGCMAHLCTIEEAILVIDLADGEPYCAIKSTKYGNGFKTFVKNRTRVPDALRRAMQK